jgi:hypothetical protein
MGTRSVPKLSTRSQASLLAGAKVSHVTSWTPLASPTDRLAMFSASQQLADDGTEVFKSC